MMLLRSGYSADDPIAAGRIAPVAVRTCRSFKSSLAAERGAKAVRPVLRAFVDQLRYFGGLFDPAIT